MCPSGNNCRYTYAGHDGPHRVNLQLTAQPIVNGLWPPRILPVTCVHTCMHVHVRCQSKTSPPQVFLTFFSKRLGIFSPNYTRLLYVPIYYLQLWWTYAILSTTTIICSKCPPSAKTHTGWSYVIWHNFVTVGDNWIKICILAYIWMCNRHVKFGLKIPNYLGKISENARVHFGQWWTFWTYVWTGWSRLIWHNFVKVADN